MLHPPLRQATSIDNVFNSAYWHLSQQDFTIDEIRSKLERKTQNTQWIDHVIAHLIEHNYLKSNLEFAIRYSESAFSNEIGQSAVERKLKRRGISASDIDEAIEHVIEHNSINFHEMACNQLSSRYLTFEGISKEKVFSQMNTRGFSKTQIDNALQYHPAQGSLRTKLAIKADKAQLDNEIIKLFRKGKGQSLILNELKQRLIDVSDFEKTINQLSLTGDIDFYESCNIQLAKKQYDLSDYTQKSKAYAYLSRKGFSSDEIKEAMSQSKEP